MQFVPIINLAIMPRHAIMGEGKANEMTIMKHNQQKLIAIDCGDKKHVYLSLTIIGFGSLVSWKHLQ